MAGPSSLGSLPARLLCACLALAAFLPASDARRSLGVRRRLPLSPAAPLRIHPRRDIPSVGRKALPGASDGALALNSQEPGPLGDGTNSSAPKLDTWITWPAGTAGPLTYHGGALLTAPISVHLVYYGAWEGAQGQAVLEGFVKSLSTSAADSLGPSVRKWWSIVTAYPDSTGATVSAQVSLGKVVTVGGQYRKQLSDGSNGGTNDIGDIVTRLIARGQLPLDGNAFYAVLTSADVYVGDSTSGFCGSVGYCGWHTQTTVGGIAIAYSLVGDASTQCPDGCGYDGGLSATPSGFPGADGMVSVLAHELAEAATNPDTSTGYWAQVQGSQGTEENADLCNGQYTDSSHPDLLHDAQNTYAYNLYGAGGLKFLVQTNVDLQKQKCVLQGSSAGLTTEPPASPAPPSAPDASPPPPPAEDSSPPPPAPEDASPPPPAPPTRDAPPPPSPPLASAPFPDPDNLAPTPDSFTLPPGLPLPATAGAGPAAPQPSSADPPSTDSPTAAPSPHEGGVSAPSPNEGSVSAPSPQGPGSGQGDPQCAGCDYESCNSCTGPDGCRCLDGSCLPLCQAAAQLQIPEPCASCGSAFCLCGADATCQGPEEALASYSTSHGGERGGHGHGKGHNDNGYMR